MKEVTSIGISTVGSRVPTLPHTIHEEQATSVQNSSSIIEDRVVISSAVASEGYRPTCLNSPLDIILKKENGTIQPDEIEFCAEQLNSSEIKSGKKNSILKKLCELYESNLGLREKTILHICQYVKGIDAINDRLVDDHINILSILISNSDYQKIQEWKEAINNLAIKLSEKLATASPYINQEHKEKLSSILLEVSKSTGLEVISKQQIITQIVDYYKTFSSALKEQSKESLWRSRLEDIVDIARICIESSRVGEGGRNKEWVINIVSDIFETTEDKRILEKILKNFPEIIKNSDILKLTEKVKLEISRVGTELECQKTQEYTREELKGKQLKLDLLKERQEVLKNHQLNFIKNSGGGDCAVYSIRDVLGIANSIISIRTDICNKVEQFARLSNFSVSIGQQLDIEGIKDEYKAIFSGDFQLFKDVVVRYYNNSLANVDNSDGTIKSLAENVEILISSGDWGDISNWDHIFNTVSTFDISYDLIIEDHKNNHPRITIKNYTQYKDHASRDGVWLNNHEINAFLLSKGYILKQSLVLNGTLLVYEHAHTRENIFLHNDGIDNGSSNAVGVHWQGVKLIDDQGLEKYEELQQQSQKLSEEIREITKKITTSSENNTFKLLENLVIAFSLRSKEDLSTVASEEDIFNRILLVGSLSKNPEVILASLVIANRLEKDDLENYYINKIISNCTDQESIILEALCNQSNLQHTECTNAFLVNQLIENKEDESRKKALNLLKQSQLQTGAIARILDLEDKIEKAEDIRESYKSIVQEEERLPYSAFKAIVGNCDNPEVQEIIKQIVDKELQVIPQFIIDQYKKLSKVTITDLTISLFEQNYLKLEELTSIGELINDLETREKAFKLLECYVLKGLKLDEPIKKQLEEIAEGTSGESSLARHILKLETGEKDAIDKLKDHAVDVDDKLGLLDQIKILSRYHNPYTVEFLLTLAEYESGFREKIIEIIINILPNNYTQEGYSNNILNKVVEFSPALDVEQLSSLVDNDKNADLTNVLYFAINEVLNSNEFNQEKVDLLLKLGRILNEMVPDKSALETLLSCYLVNSAIIASSHSNKAVRNAFTEVIKSYPEDKLTQLKITREVIASIETSNLDVQSKEDLELLRSYILGNKYLPTDEQLAKLITFLSNSELSNLASEILFATLQVNNISTDNLEKFFDIIKIHPELLREKNILNILQRYIREDIVSIIEHEVRNNTLPAQLEEQAICLLSTMDKKYQEEVLNKMSVCMLSTRDKNTELHIANYFVAQIEKSNCSKLPTEVISAMRLIAQKDRTSGNHEIQQLCFKGLSTFYLCIDQKPYTFVKDCASKLHAYLTKQLESNYYKAQNAVDDYDQDKLEELLSDYQKSKDGLIKFHNLFSNQDQDNINGAYKQLHGLCNAINLSLHYIGTLDLKIFNTFGINEWTEEILIRTLFSSSNKVNQTNTSEYSQLTFIKRLEALESTYNGRTGTIETFDTRWKVKVLEELLNKQEKFDYSLKDINDLMGYAASNITALELLKKDNFWNELESSWIKNKLCNIKEMQGQQEGLEDKIQKLADLLTSYSYEVVDGYFTKINSEDNSLEGVIKFFTKLRNSNLNLDSKEIFLTKLESVSIEDAETTLYKAISSAILSIKLKNNSSDYQLELAEPAEPYIEISDTTLISKGEENIATLLSNGWQIGSLALLISKVNDEQSLKELNRVLIPISDYSLKEYDTNIQDEKLIDILGTQDLSSCAKRVHELAVFSTFNIPKEKGIEELAKELEEFNSIEYTNQKNIIAEYKAIVSKYNTITNSKGIQLSAWGTDEIREWSGKLKNKEISSDIYEKLAVIKRAVEVSSKERGKEISPRPIQLMSALILLNAEDKKGRLAQIGTGEGKTTITAMLAAYKALDGHQVDVITSSPELAKPQSEQQKLFFKQFGLNVAHNGKDDSVAIEERYKADIVYGAAGDFQGDILRDEYNKLGTRSGRKCDVAIVDEVDSMLIDGKNHMVMLSSPMPAMDYLEPVLCTIWQQVDSCANAIEERDGEVYYVQKSSAIGDDGKMIQSEEVLYQIESTKEEFIKNTTEKYIRKLLRDGDLIDAQEFFDEILFEQKKLEETRDGRTKTDNQIKKEVIDKVKKSFPELVIPKHLRNFVLKAQLPKWIDSAIHAKYRSEIDKHYVLKDGNKIAPVDASNTGVVQANMNWSNGLHQFLQIKHGCNITPESITTNFISNVTYFKRYGSNIYGLTGTLGSEKAKELLHETYKVDSVILPTFKQKQYKELAPIIIANKEDWYDSIIESNINKLENGRGVLIITKYIEEIDEINKRLIARGYDKSKIKLYKTEQDSGVIEQELKSGEIIIATNIAGRGTDIIPSRNVEKNGGLHVCVTFMPPNERVEQQNIGRTSRTGNKGTSQLVILDKEHSNIDAIRLIRNIKEEISLEKAKSEITKVTTKDRIFEEFCSLLDEIDPTRGKKDVLTTDDILQIHNRRVIEEKFGLWLQVKSEELEKTTEKGAIKLFNEFAEEMRALWSNLESGGVANINPIFCILKGNVLLKEQRYDEAIVEFNKAIEIDEHFAANAYYNRGYARIAEYCGEKNLALQDEYSVQVKLAIADFEKARKIIEENLEPMLHVIQRSLFSNGGEEVSPVLSEQVQHKLYLYNMQKNAINAAIGIGEVQYNKQIEELQAKLDATGDKALSGKDKESVENYLKFLKDNRTEQIKGEIGKIQDKNRGMEIEFNDIYKSFPEDEDVNLYKEEIEEYKNNGFQGTFRVTEIVPIDWWSVIGVALIGLGQLVGGAALTVFTLGAGSSIGMGMMAEGVSDLITAVKDGIINRDFSWEQWGIQKAISMAVSLVCAGMGAIKDAAKTAVAGVKSAVSIATKTVTTTVKEGWKLAAKAMGIAIAKGVAKETINTLVDYGIQQLAMPAIEESLTKSIEPKIQEALLANPNVEKMLKLDSKNRNKHYQNQIKNIAMQLIYKNDEGIGKKILGYTRQFAEGVISGKAGASQNKYARIFAHAGTVAGMAEAIAELVKFLPEFTAELDKKINELAIKDGLNQDTGAKGLKETELVQKENKETNITYTTSQTFDATESIEGQIGKRETNHQKATQEAVNYSPGEVVSTLSVSVANNMGNTIKGKLFKPLTNMAVSCGVDRLSKGIDKAQQEAIGNFQAERRVQFAQDGNMHRIPKQMQKIANDPEAQSKAGSITQDLKEGGEAGLAHMGAISDEVNRPIKVFDEQGKLVKVIGEEKGGKAIEVRYEKPNDKNPNGHYTLNKKDANGNYLQANATGKNNCLFDVVTSQLDRNHPLNSGTKLREGVVGRLETPEGQSKLAMVAYDIARLEQYKPNALAMGGAKYNGSSPSDAERILDNSQGKAGHGYPTKKGHPRGHVSDPAVTTKDGSVEIYSKKTDPNYPKTGFLNRADQNDAAHNALRTPEAQFAMHLLNYGPGSFIGPYPQGVILEPNRAIVTVPTSLTQQMGEWNKNGRVAGTKPISQTTLWLQHHQGQQSNPNADVHVFTFFPRS